MSANFKFSKFDDENDEDVVKTTTIPEEGDQKKKVIPWEDKGMYVYKIVIHLTAQYAGPMLSF